MKRKINDVTVRIWTAGGIHAWVTYPDGSWEHRVWKAAAYWEADSLIIGLVKTYGKDKVTVL